MNVFKLRRARRLGGLLAGLGALVTTLVVTGTAALAMRVPPERRRRGSSAATAADSGRRRHARLADHAYRGGSRARRGGARRGCRPRQVRAQAAGRRARGEQCPGSGLEGAMTWRCSWTSTRTCRSGGEDIARIGDDARRRAIHRSAYARSSSTTTPTARFTACLKRPTRRRCASTTRHSEWTAARSTGSTVLSKGVF